jgi:hypothetical protein
MTPEVSPSRQTQDFASKQEFKPFKYTSTVRPNLFVSRIEELFD